MNVKEELNKLSNLFNNGYYDEVINKCKNIIIKYPSESFFYNFVGIGFSVSILYFFIASFACLEGNNCSFANTLKE